ncbi:MAG TPA: glycoside hydrolase family 3 N-terminal domain-containing protein, partial [Fibrobacteria bacterium]|nr:glycoside hydrolase family 3 N-terminal domain-containing protein [Fibrobacteria bacterium]
GIRKPDASPGTKPDRLKLKLSPLAVEVDIPEPGLAEFTVFDSKGRSAGAKTLGFSSRGRYAINASGLFAHEGTGGIYFIRVQVNGKRAVGKWIPASGRSSSLNVRKIGTLDNPGYLAKAGGSQALDSLRVGKTGFFPKYVEIASYDASVGDVAIVSANVEGRVDSLFALLSPEEKIGQIIMSDFAFDPGWNPAGEPSRATHDDKNSKQITKYYLGFQMSKGNQEPVEGNIPLEWSKDVIRIQGAARETPKKIPLIVASDLVHGANSSTGTVIMPHNIGLGATRDTALVEKVYRVTALEARGLGYNFTYAPSVSIPRHLGWGRTYEGFSEEPTVARQMAGAAIRGLQGTDLSSPYTIGATAKHFVGDGATLNGVDGPDGIITGDNGVALTNEQLLAIHLPPYQEAVKWGVASIMPSLSRWKGSDASPMNLTAKDAFLTDTLKTKMGFDGFVQGDYHAHWRVSGSESATVENTTRSFTAGLDVPMTWQQTHVVTMVGQLKTMWPAHQARLEDAVKRVLRIKYRLGLFDSDPGPDPRLFNLIGSTEHRAVAREAVRKSLVLLKNEAAAGGKRALPLGKTSSIHLVGRHADDLGNQCGGWTVTWEGKSGRTTTGTTLLDAFKKVNPSVTQSKTVSSAADVNVVVVGDSTYAETNGDVGRNDSKFKLLPDQTAYITQAKATGKPLVCVLISGRPIDITNEISQCDAFVAAWYPGTEGDGVADVLFGDFDFSGRLTFTWPRSYSQEPVNVGDADYDAVNVLYRWGHGLKLSGTAIP